MIQIICRPIKITFELLIGSTTHVGTHVHTNTSPRSKLSTHKRSVTHTQKHFTNNELFIDELEFSLGESCRQRETF